MTPLVITGLSLFILILFLGLFASVLSFPGTAIIVGDVFIYAILTGFATIGFKIILLLVILSILAEAVDFALGMAGAARIDSSARAISAAAFGSCAGTLLLTPFLMGPGTLLGILLGGLIGLVFVELIRQSKMKPTLRPPISSILGSIFAVFFKGGTAVVMIIVVLLNVYS